MSKEKNENDYKVTNRFVVVQTEEEFRREMKLSETKKELKEEVRRIGMSRIKNFLKHTDKELCLLMKEIWQELDRIDRIGVTDND